WQAAPFAAVLLADLGAEVIKIEPPVTGDPNRVPVQANALRNVDEPVGAASAATFYDFQNRNKRGMNLDLTRPPAMEVFHRLIDTADVFVQNFRLGVAERLGLGYADLRARNPGLVYASVTGLGRAGPDRALPMMDLLGQARG